MRLISLALLLTLLSAPLALSALGQGNAAQRRSAVAGTWVHQDDPSELRLEIDTSATADTLRLILAGHHTSEGVHRETIVCVLDGFSSEPLSISYCPQTTLARKAPPRDSSLRLEPQSKAERGLRRIVEQFVETPVQSGDSLAVGAEERFWLVRQP